MKKRVFSLFLFALVFTADAQTFSEFVSGLPKVTIPLKFNDNYFLAWTGQSMSATLFNSAQLDLAKYKAVGVVDFPETYVILAKGYFNGGTDFQIIGLSYSKTGSYCCKKVFALSSDSGGLDFSVTGSFEIKIFRYGPESGTVSTYGLVNNNFVDQGTPVTVTDARSYKKEN